MRFVSRVSVQWVRRRSCPLFLPHSPSKSQIMKKSKPANPLSKRKQEKVEEKETSAADNALDKIDSLDDEDRGFGGWLRSADGLETMKLFVIANSIVMITTLAYPHIQTFFATVSEVFNGSEGLYIDYGM